MSERNDDARPHGIAARARAATIATLNDALRRYPISGRLTVTAGVIALGKDALPAVLAKVAAFDAFTDDNDPYGERDFGSFDYAGARLFWKIDYYNRSMSGASPDPSKINLTLRVLTVMLAEEY